MTELKPMARYAKRVARDAAIARRRSLDRQLGGPLFWKYVQIVPAVFTARGEFAAFKLLVSVEEATRRLSDSAVLTLDSATERLGGFRFGRGHHLYAYFEAASDLDTLARDTIGQPMTDHWEPWLPSLQEQSMLFAVVCKNLPPYRETADCRLVTREQLVRDLLGYYGLRRDLLVEIENKLD